jgi:hypothetical protein
VSQEYPWKQYGRSFPKREERHDKLLAAAAFVEQIPHDQFNIDHWWLPDGLAFDDDRNRQYRVSCGTVGCAVGHMTHAGAFGLTADVLKNPRQRVMVIIGDCFGVSFKLAEFMFDQYGYSLGRPVTVADVVRRIRYVASEMQGG